MRLLLLVSLLSVCAADYFLQRSWPLSSTCDATTPSFSYADLGPSELGAGNLWGQCVTSADNSYNTLYACYNSTHAQVTAWNPVSNCTGTPYSGYPQIYALLGATGGCVTSPGGTGSAMAMCVISSSPYTPLSSEPFVNVLYLQNSSSSSVVCASPAAYIGSLSAAAPACSAILQPSGAFSNFSWGSIAFSSPCLPSGASGNMSYAIYNS